MSSNHRLEEVDPVNAGTPHRRRSAPVDAVVARFLILSCGYVTIGRFVFDAAWETSVIGGVATAAVVVAMMSIGLRRRAR